MSAGTKINRKGEAVIAALLTQPTHAAAAAAAGVSEATVQRWLRDPAFAAAYRLARRSVVETAIGQLQQATADAVHALRRNLTCGVPAVEVRAAVAVLDQAVNGVLVIDFEARVEELERILTPTPASPASPWAIGPAAEGGGE
jgi:hypothetical protein